MAATRLTAAARPAAVLLVTVLVTVLAGLPAVPSAAARTDEGGRALLTVRDPRITEASGLAVSIRHDGILYVHNDSDDAPRFYAVGPDGSTRATFTLRGAEARDWEAMATGRDSRGRPVLYIADIGDNLGGAWRSVSVSRVREPRRLRDATVPATRFRFRYADGARNAEALLVHPRTGRLYVASREWQGGLYVAPKRLRADGVNTLRRVGPVPPLVTGGDFAPDGRRLVLRTYVSATVYTEPGGRPVARIALPDQPQGESIAYARDGRALLVGSEGAGSTVWRVPLSPRQRGERPSPAPSLESGGEGDSGYGGWALLIAGAGATLVIAMRRSRRR